MKIITYLVGMAVAATIILSITPFIAVIIVLALLAGVSGLMSGYPVFTCAATNTVSEGATDEGGIKWTETRTTRERKWVNGTLVKDETKVEEL